MRIDVTIARKYLKKGKPNFSAEFVVMCFDGVKTVLVHDRRWNFGSEEELRRWVMTNDRFIPDLYEAIKRLL